MDQNNISLAMLEKFPEGTIGQDVLRYVGLPRLLGHENDTLLYFFGRELARQIQGETLEDLPYIFHKLQWGNLEIIKEKKNEYTFHLMADEIVERLKSPLATEFRIEAGFIAETLQHLFQRHCECVEKVHERLYRIDFTAYFTD